MFGLSPEALDLVLMIAGLLSLFLLVLSFLAVPILGPIASILGAGAAGWGWWRRRKQGRKNIRTAIGLWAGIPAILIFLTTLGLVLFF